jgi:dipeptidase E
MQLLLLSNSTNIGEGFLDYAREHVLNFFKEIKGYIIFVPFAAVRMSYDDYEYKVKAKFNEFGLEVRSIHHFEDKVAALENASAIMIGGGNTFSLLSSLQKFGLLSHIRNLVLKGKPYLGWSAGSNVACPTICTTNDMPIVEVENFNALNLIPFQINPHYIDTFPENFAGETRDERISEFLMANIDKTVIGLREGTLLSYSGNQLKLWGPWSLKVFRYNQSALELSFTDNLNFLIS